MTSQEVRQFLRDSSKLIKQNGTKGWAYRNMYDFVAKEGIEFNFESNFPWIKGPPSQCFANAMTLCSFHKNIRYVEGYAFSIAFPMYHAWCIDEGGKVIETTWDSMGSGYVGVIFPKQYVKKIVAKSGEYSVIDKWKIGWPLLTGEHDYQSLKKELEVA